MNNRAKKPAQVSLFRGIVTVAILLIAPTASTAQRPDSRAQPISDTTHVFQLGEVEVFGSHITVAERLAEHISINEFRATGRRDLSEALSLFPGVVLQRIGPRNESGVRVRGFDLRHVPLYQDGIPVYVPYDGFVDLARFVTTDVSRITLAKGFSSLLYGPNAMGGAINIVSRIPEHRYEGNVKAGWRSPDGREVSLSLGTRRSRWFALADATFLDQTTFSLSSAFSPAPAENGGRRENAARKDAKISAKTGFSPNPGTIYVLGYVYQQGEKENPPYAGSEDGIRVRHWQWPYWDKESVYLIADQALGRGFQLRGRLFYDQFESALYGYDDETYSSQKKPFSFQSFNDDNSYGGSLQPNKTTPAGHALGIATHLKLDRHNERDMRQSVGRYEDVTFSLSVEDDFPLPTGGQAVAGLMYSVRRTESAQRIDLEQVFPNTKNGSIEGHVAILQPMSESSYLFVSMGHRSRFPTIKDRYSYRENRALPNPSLKPERALKIELGFEGIVLLALRIQAALYHSHITDVIQTGDVTKPGTELILAQLQNSGSARHRGGEATLRFRAASWLNAEGSYSYVHLENLSDPSLLFTHTPSHALSVHLEAVPSDKLALRSWMSYTSSRLTRIEGTTFTELNGQLTVDAEAMYEARQGIRLTGGVRNVLDSDYQIVAGYPEPGRSFFARLSYTFQTAY